MEVPLSSGRSCGRFRGFTLIEFLVVVGLIAVLASIAIPSFSKARAVAISAQCVSNQRQLGIGIQQYTHDFGYYPAFRHTSRFSKPLEAYLGSSKVDEYGMDTQPTVFHCPQGHPLQPHCPTEPGVRQWDIQRYRFNTDGSTYQDRASYSAQGRATLKLKDGTEVPALGLFGRHENAVAAPSDMISVTCLDGLYDLPRLSFYKRNYMWHRDRVNVGFADGHLESGPVSAWMVADPSVRRRWNVDFEPHEEYWNETLEPEEAGASPAADAAPVH